MTKTKTAAVILAAGLGTRMKSATPKVLHALAGRPMIVHLLETLKPLGLARRLVVIGDGMAGGAQAVEPSPTVLQKPAPGTVAGKPRTTIAGAGFFRLAANMRSTVPARISGLSA